MKFPRIIHLDPSDARVFDPPAEPGEPALPGSFAFTDTDPESLGNKARRAFHHGWLGIGSFGRATFVQIGEIDEAGFEDVVEQLTVHFVAHYGAPNREAAHPVARAQAEDAVELCTGAPGTLLSIERDMTEQGLSERVRAIHREPARDPAPAWTIDNDASED